ncbi:MAG: phosphate acyltransferase PlsX [Mariprofundaceae bacterium]
MPISNAPIEGALVPVNGESSALPRILIDGHGGDLGSEVTVEALAISLANDRVVGAVHLGIVGRKEELEPVLSKYPALANIEIIAASDIIEMCDPPALAARRKKDSAIHVGTRLVRDGKWDALVSAGNTGALMAISKLILKTVQGVDRPAFATMVPTLSEGGTFFLDIGANIDCTSEHLLQFALMGSCYMQAAEGVDLPRIGLLNVGSEDIKGTDVVKVAADKLRQADINFIGNVEGSDIFLDTVDVVVCDGFIGNIALKTMEGTAKLILHHMKAALTSSITAKAGAFLAKPALTRLKQALHPSEHNGAPLLGLNGIVVKSHGSANAHAFACAIEVARREVNADLTHRIVSAMNAWSEK